MRAELGHHQEAFYSKSSIPRPHIVRAEGLRYFTDDGTVYIDANAGAAVANIGSGNKRVLNAMVDQGRKMTFSYVRFSRHDPNLELTARIAELAGPGFERVHLANDGSEANEMAIKFLRNCAYAAGRPAKRKVISLSPSYHGGTLGTMGWTGDSEYTAKYGDMMVPSTKVPAPLTYRPMNGLSGSEAALWAAQQLEEAILELGPENVLAFIMEPVGGTATGANVAPPAYLRAVREICNRHGVYLVFDEVMSATRTGAFLAAHHQPEARPDAVVIAKGLGAGYVPLAAAAFPRELVDTLTQTSGFDLSHTYNANPISCAAGCAVLDEMVDHHLIENGAQMGDLLKARLDELATRWPMIGDVRGKGLMLGVELVSDRDAKTAFPGAADASGRVRRVAMRNGLLIGGRRLNGGAFGEFLMLTPALIITPDDIEEMVQRLDLTLKQVTENLHADGFLKG
ncbi:aspartate aminotransferase family protein [Streptomyces fuscichromogenes]|uniref:aminotransferase family protein n=1 Tax=Streptomyces fuscichromogenes TaxID=1324013 RepID=UPI00380C32D6